MLVSHEEGQRNTAVSVFCPTPMQNVHFFVWNLQFQLKLQTESEDIFRG